jgi:hypothetical protein
LSSVSFHIEFRLISGDVAAVTSAAPVVSVLIDDSEGPVRDGYASVVLDVGRQPADDLTVVVRDAAGAEVGVLTEYDGQGSAPLGVLVDAACFTPVDQETWASAERERKGDTPLRVGCIRFFGSPSLFCKHEVDITITL